MNDELRHYMLKVAELSAEIKNLHASEDEEISKLRAALKAVEWIPMSDGTYDGTNGVCPWCNGFQPNHGLNCQRQTTLGIKKEKS